MLQVVFEKNIEIKGRTLTVSVEADGSMFTENFGADADGNRGEMRTELDDFGMTIKDLGGRDITEALATRYPKEYESIESLAEEKLYEAYEAKQSDDYADYYEGDHDETDL